MFPTKEDITKIALELLSKKIKIYHVTDDVSSLNVRVYNLPPGCWYIIYKNSINDNCILESSYLLAISKVDGRVLYDGSAGDEG